MPVAEIVTIGTELLLGEIQDTNTRTLARALRDAGIDIYRATMVGDNAGRIAQAIQEALQRANIVITTGGLGPTVDDPTRAAIAQAVGVDLEFRPDLWAQIEARLQRYGRAASENNRRQAFIPAGSLAIENPVGTAPAFAVRHGQGWVIALPGVPREMEYLLNNAVIPMLRSEFQLTGIIKATVLHAAALGESLVDELVADLETTTNPTVGLLAHPGQVDIRITAKAADPLEADHMIAEMADKVRQRLGDNIYGADEETLSGAALSALSARGWSLCAQEYALGGALFSHLSGESGPAVICEVQAEPVGLAALKEQISWLRANLALDVGLGASLRPGVDRQELILVLVTPESEREQIRSYGGVPANAATWAANQALDLLRRSV
jgi:competence/damage-inducible protein CinA-like protein